MEANNTAAMREALKVIRGMVNEEMEDLKDISDEVRADFISIRGWCDHALAAPPRNCDVGTAEEQEMRFDAFCKGVNGCRDCIIHIRGQNNYCHFAWAQTPYDESEVKS